MRYSTMGQSNFRRASVGQFQIGYGWNGGGNTFAKDAMRRSEKLQVRTCVDCGLACDLAERNEDCWMNNPSCADCLWASDIIRCP